MSAIRPAPGPEAARQLVSGRRLTVIMDDDEARRSAAVARTVLSCTTDENTVLWVRNRRREPMTADLVIEQLAGPGLPGPEYDLGRQAKRSLQENYGEDAQIIVVVDQADCLDVPAMLALCDLAEAAEASGFWLQILFVGPASLGLTLADDRLAGLRAALFGPSEAVIGRDRSQVEGSRGGIAGSIAGAVLVFLAVGVLVTQTTLFDRHAVTPVSTANPTASATVTPAPLPAPLSAPTSTQNADAGASLPTGADPLADQLNAPAIPPLKAIPEASAETPARPVPEAAMPAPSVGVAPNPGRAPVRSASRTADGGSPGAVEPSSGRPDSAVPSDMDQLQAEFETHLATMNPPMPHLTTQQRALLFKQYLTWREAR